MLGDWILREFSSIKSTEYFEGNFTLYFSLYRRSLCKFICILTTIDTLWGTLPERVISYKFRQIKSPFTCQYRSKTWKLDVIQNYTHTHTHVLLPILYFYYTCSLYKNYLPLYILLFILLLYLLFQLKNSQLQSSEKGFSLIPVISRAKRSRAMIAI